MVDLRIGDILASKTEALVNTVNCVGIMGRGIALQFKRAYPENFKAYAVACKKNEVATGKLFVWPTGTLTNPKFIINFPTKRHWRNKSRLNDIEEGLKDLVRVIKKYEIKSIAIPPLGCGLGGLKWEIVRPMITEYLDAVPEVEVELYEPSGKPKRKNYKSDKKVKMTPGRAALVGLMERYLSGLMEPFVSLLEVHKLMYFMQEAGQPLKLRFVKAPYGPYAENLRHVLEHVEGHYISGFSDEGDRPDLKLELCENATKLAKEYLDSDKETLERFDKVTTLVQGFESPLGVELLATVHWVAKREGATSFDKVVAQIRKWNVRKRNIPERHIKIAFEALNEHGWLN